MGTPEGCPDGEEIDCSAGKIVWVRRRNGSWWPGRIIGIDELSASHLMSPRSGTPVKLLGREDASVDWYNLEKSKRVKAFRCGEFNDCIERAEAAQGNPLKKREKYARREDAILHALELEKEQLHRNRHKLGISSKHLGVNSGLSENYYEKDEIADTHESGTLKAIPLSWKTGAPFDEEGMANPLQSREEKHMRLSSHEDGNSEMFQRMRGLQDFGLRTASSKRKLPAPVSLADGDNIVLPNHVGNSKNPLTVKRKRSHNGPIEERFVKRRDRRRPLVQVLQSSAKLPSFDPLASHDDDASMDMYGERVGAVFRAKRSKCVYFPADDYMNRLEYPSHEMQASGLLDTNNTFFRSSEDEESDSSEEDLCDENMEETTTAYSDSAQVLAVREPSNSNNSAGKGQMLELEDLDESTLSSYGSHSHMYEQNSGISTDVAGSKWQLKGKRNIRNAFKRPSEAMDTNHSPAVEKCNGSNQLTIYDSKNTLIKRTSQRAVGGGSYGRRDDPIYDYYYDDDDDDGDDDGHDGEGSMENDLIDGSLIEYGSKRYPFMSKMHSVQETSDDDTTDLDEDSEPGIRGYWGESDECFNPYYVGHFGNSLNMLLLDVDLKVQVSYKREQVPLVSLMSRLNGKAIIGHPLQVEKLEDGSSQLLFPRNDNGEGLSTYDDDDGNSGLQPVWRTARRTVMHRVPRSHPSSAFDVDETELVQYSDIENRPKPYVSPFNNKGRAVKKNSFRPQALSEKKNSKKQSKKVSLTNQKTRTLSSIATEQRFSDHIPAVKLERPVKPEGVTPLACVPVKLVFSRIKEAVGKVPSLPERKLS